MPWPKGKTGWNRGLSADPNKPNYDLRVAKSAAANMGKPSGALGKTWKWSDVAKERQSKRMKGNTSWNKGLTKYTDPRVAKSGKSLSKYINSNPQYKQTLIKNRTKNNKGRKPWNWNETKETNEYVAKYSNTLSGMPKSLEHREKISKMRQSQSPEERSRIGRLGGLAAQAKLTPEERTEWALNMLLKMPRTDTSIELLLQKLLSEHNVSFNTQELLLNITAVDIFIPPNICIFADGNYWHKYPEGRKSDRKRTRKLLQNGYKVLRFWGSEIRNNPEECLLKILDTIKS